MERRVEGDRCTTQRMSFGTTQRCGSGLLLAATLAPAVALGACHREQAPRHVGTERVYRLWEAPPTAVGGRPLTSAESPSALVGAVGAEHGPAASGRAQVGSAGAAPGDGSEGPPVAWEGADARSLFVFVTLDVPGRLPPNSVLRVELADASRIGEPVRPVAKSELFVSRSDRLQIQLDVPEQSLVGVQRVALSARVDRGPDLLAITMVPLLLQKRQLAERLELWVAALPAYEADPGFDRWLLDPDELRESQERESVADPVRTPSLPCPSAATAASDRRPDESSRRSSRCR